MKDFSELAVEAAESAGERSGIEERRLSRRLRYLLFKAGEGTGTLGEARYHTLLTDHDAMEGDVSSELSQALSRILEELLPRRADRILAVGLGNPSTVVDSLGCETVKLLSAGRRRRGALAALVPSVYGLTGLETASVVRGVAGEYAPDFILTVDTLSTRRAERLSRAVQIGEGGVVPGGGVDNAREPLSERTVGVPVLSLGVPLLARAEACSSLPAGLVVTPKEIDLLVPIFARILAAGIEGALSDQLG